MTATTGESVGKSKHLLIVGKTIDWCSEWKRV